jgi:hypothetical protein
MSPGGSAIPDNEPKKDPQETKPVAEASHAHTALQGATAGQSGSARAVSASTDYSNGRAYRTIEAEDAQTGFISSSLLSLSVPTAQVPQSLGMGVVGTFDYDAVVNQVLASIPQRSLVSFQSTEQQSPQQQVAGYPPNSHTDTHEVAETSGSDVTDLERKPAPQIPAASQSYPAGIVITTPRDNDVLFGRGKSILNHPGNKQMRKIAKAHQTTYDTTNRDDKTEITRMIVMVVKSDGGSFLKYDKAHNGWVEVPDDIARKKIAHAMRDGRSKPLGQLDTDDSEPFR